MKKIPYKINDKVILSFFIMTPATLSFFLFDSLFNESSLIKKLPTDPHHLDIFLIFFMLPHIFLGIFTFADADYVIHYKDLLKKLVFISFFTDIFFRTLLPNLYSPAVLSFTVYHLISQQIGVTKKYFILNWKYKIWKWSQIILILSIYLEFKHHNIFGHLLDVNKLNLALVGVISFCSFCIRSKKKMGVYYLVANTLTTLTIFFFYVKNISFLSILIARVIHDMTAIYYYSVHNVNRNYYEGKNYFYNLTKGIPLLIFGWSILMVISFNIFVVPYVIRYLPIAIGPIGLFHYYSECYVWKKGSLHRRYTPS